MNEFLKTRDQINSATDWLKENGYTTHPISCKDWEMKQVIESAKDGDFLDMGADGSRVLHNVVIKGVKGKKIGIDLAEVTGDNRAEGAEYYQGDLMHTPFDDGSFDTITCLSVIEHSVRFDEIAKECSRLLRERGSLFISYDYWTPKPDTSKTKLYSLDWNILDAIDGINLVNEMKNNGLHITGDIDWGTRDAVINDQYCSPAKGVSYTFRILEFTKI